MGTKMRLDNPTFNRFIVKLDKSGKCWIWKAYKNKYGYGVFRFNKKMGLAHRFAFIYYVRELLPKETVDHKCFNRACCNPKHLQALSHKDNVERSTKRNRLKPFCRHGHDQKKHGYIDCTGAKRCIICRREQIKRAKQKHKIRYYTSNH